MSIRFIPTFRQTNTAYTKIFENFTQNYAKNHAHSAGTSSHPPHASYQKPSQFDTHSHPSAYSFTRSTFPPFNRPSFIHNMQGGNSSHFQYAKNIDVSPLFTHMMKQMIDQLGQAIHTSYLFNFAQDYSRYLLAALTQLYNQVHNATFPPRPPFSTTGPSAYTNTKASTAGPWSYPNNSRPRSSPFGNHAGPSASGPSDYANKNQGILSSNEMARRNLCANLDLPADTPDHALRSAYRKAALNLHPDKGGDAAVFIELNTLYGEWQAGPQPTNGQATAGASA